MAPRERNKNFLRSLIDDQEQIEAMINSDCDQCIMKAGHSILNKCGNCQYRFKCGTDTINILRERTDLDQKLGLQGVSSSNLMEMIDHSYQFMRDEMGEEKIKVLMFDLIEILDADPKEILSSVDEIFSQCQEYNELQITQMIGGDDIGN